MDEDLDEHLNKPHRPELYILLVGLLLLAVWMLFGGTPEREVDLHKLNPHTYETESP